MPLSKSASRTPNGGGSRAPHPIDVHVGKRIRLRRLFLGMNQETLANALGLTFQQVQKYEGGANRVAASRLSAIADTLRVPISFFFDGLRLADSRLTPEEQKTRQRMERPETIELLRLYYSIPDVETRQQYLDLLKAIASDGRLSKEAAKSQEGPAVAGVIGTR